MTLMNLPVGISLRENVHGLARSLDLDRFVAVM
jgi:hypothetical protein